MPNKLFISGVYCIKTLDTKLIYIGSSKNIHQRIALHKSAFKKKDLRRGTTAFFDSPKEKIVFSLLEECPNYLEREQYWIDFYRNQDVYRIVNVFDADRCNSTCSKEFKDKMSQIRKEKWKDPTYRENTLKKILPTMFTIERLNKKVHVYTAQGIYKGYFKSAKSTAIEMGVNPISIAASARGQFKNKFKHKNFIFIYEQVRVLNKLSELLELHQELRTISSQAWEASFEYHEGSTTNQ